MVIPNLMWKVFIMSEGSHFYYKCHHRTDVSAHPFKERLY